MMHARRLVAAGMLGTLAMLAPLTSQAGTKEITYVAFQNFRASTEEVPVGIGGYSFTTPAKPKAVKVLDTNGNGVAVVVCQENEAPVGDVPNLCGDGADDVYIDYCTDGTSEDISTLKANSPFTVFVKTTDDTLACEQFGSVGTMTVTW